MSKLALSSLFISTRLKQLFVVFCTSLLLSGCLNPAGSQQGRTQSYEQNIIKSPTDTRDYLAFTLDNQLQVLVISDPKADKAAASLSITVGSGSDPKNREGLAHFLEHMLFLGTEKYPEAGEYQQFISDHSGSHNAYTAFDETNYFFDVNAADLEPSLDRFAQFFIAPLFNAEYVEREKHAVNSEYQAKIKDDSRLQYEVLKTVSNPDHPYSQFSVGSLQTLADDENQSVRDDLIKFYQQHYSANLMSLVVLGNESANELRELVTTKFAKVANRNSPTPSFNQPLFTDKQLPQRINTQPHKDLRQVSYLFPVPSTRPYFESKPTYYLSNLLGHEGQGSLLSFLKSQGWADSLSAGIGFESDQQAALQIKIGLTKKGLKNTDAVTRALFQSIELIKQQGIEKWRYQEQAQLAQLGFEFQENGNNMHYVTRLASQLKYVPTAEILSAPYQMSDYEPQLIASYLAALRPDNMLMMVVAKNLPTDQISQHFSAHYATSPISEQQQKAWLNAPANNAITLPKANPFIPTRLNLVQSSSIAAQKPKQGITNSGISYWHSIDTSFKTPKTDFYFTLRSPLANQSAVNVALTALYVKSVNEQLNEFSYPASLAGLGYQLYPHVRGISVRISGYNDKQPRLLEEILTALTNPAIDTAFNRHKEELLRSWNNALKQKPYNQSLSKTSQLITSPSWSEVQLIEALKPLQADDLQQFSQRFLQQLAIEVLGNGNISDQEMSRRVQQLENGLTQQRPVQAIARPQVRKLPTKQNLLYPFEVKHNDNAVTQYIQGESKDIATRARFALFNQILSTPFFHELRTRQQLGYIVFSSPMSLLDVPALTFTVQSPNSSPEKIVSAIDDFIAEGSNILNGLDETALNAHKRALIGNIMAKDTRLSQRSDRYWREIDRENFQFDSREQLVTAIQTIDLATLKAAYQHDFIENSRQLTSIATANTGNLEIKHHRTVDEKQLIKLSEGFVE